MKYKLRRLKSKLVSLFLGTDAQRIYKAKVRADIHNSNVTYRHGLAKGFESMEHFVERLKYVANEIEEAYYMPTLDRQQENISHDKLCDMKINEAIEVLKGAKTFNRLNSL